jgi:adenylate cyclase
VQQLWRFGRFEIRPDERSLRVAGEPAVLGARAFDVLLALVQRRDRVVTKNELLDLVWPGVVVEENNLTVQIHSLRKVLGTGAIATIAGRGYRFVLAPTEAEAPDAGAGAASGDRIERRLATIAFAQIVGWVDDLVRDPAAAVASWKATRSTLIEHTVPTFGGRVLDLSPQGVALEFRSAVEAVLWALELQDRLAERRAAGDTLRLRVGLCVEDMVVDEGKLIGEGVQWAGRIAESGAPDQVLVDDSVMRFVQRRAPVRFVALPLPDGAAREMLATHTRDRPLAVYRAERASAPASAGSIAIDLAWGARPAVAVLPFVTEGDPYFGDGMTEEIVTSLSLNRGLLVISRNSTLRYRGSARPLGEIAAELGVRYLIVGAVRRNGHQLRISAELVDASSNRIIWAERFDGEDKDLFGFQAQIASAIAAAIDPQVQQAEIARASVAPTGNLSAYDHVLRGMALTNIFRSEEFRRAGDHFRRATELDPRYAQAHAHLAWWHNLRVGEGWSAESEEDRRLAEHHAQRAASLDPRDAVVLSVLGHIQSFIRRRFTVAMELFDQALTVNPNCAVAWARSGTTLAYMGRGDEALQRVNNALRLSPFDPLDYAFYTTNGTAAIVAGRVDEAVGWLAKARRRNEGYRAAFRLQIAALAMAGELDEARELAAEFRQLEPTFDVARFGLAYPLTEPHLGRLLEALRLAGLPG